MATPASAISMPLRPLACTAFRVDADQDYLGKWVVASAVKGVDTAVDDTIKMVSNNTFNSTISQNPIRYFNMQNQGAGATFNSSSGIPASVMTKVKAWQAQVEAGAVLVPHNSSTDATPSCGTVSNPC